VNPSTEAGRAAGERSAELALLLKAWIWGKGIALTELSRRMGLFPAYLGRVVNGVIPLKLTTVFGIFAALGERPDRFFDQHYPLGGRGPAGPEEEPSVLDAPGEPSLRALVALVEGAEAPVSPAERAARAGRLLREAILRGRTTHRAVSRALGLSEDSLGNALRRAQGPTAWQLFGTLHVVGMTPGRFFAELFSPEDEGGSPRVSGPEVWDAVEKLLEGGSASRGGDEPEPDGTED